MAKDQIKRRLVVGTYVRHKTAGYEGKIDGTTAMKGCFTSRGAPLVKSEEQFQYRIAVAGETMRRIAPADDLEIVEPKPAKAPTSTPKPQSRKLAGKKKPKQVR